MKPPNEGCAYAYPFEEDRPHDSGEKKGTHPRKKSRFYFFLVAATHRGKLYRRYRGTRRHRGWFVTIPYRRTFHGRQAGAAVMKDDPWDQIREVALDASLEKMLIVTHSAESMRERRTGPRTGSGAYALGHEDG